MHEVLKHFNIMSIKLLLTDVYSGTPKFTYEIIFNTLVIL
jgi:hypothetical protein